MQPQSTKPGIYDKPLVRDAGPYILEPLLTVIIPVFNEAKTIDQSIRQVLVSPLSKQVIVVDDGSTDGTADILNKWQNNPEIEILKHPINQGKGAAIRTGLEKARGIYTIIQDGDLEYDPMDYPLILKPLLDGQAHVVYGSRYLGRRIMGIKGRFLISIGIWVLNFCVRCFYGTILTDIYTCYKAFPTETLRFMDLRCESFDFCPEVTAKACRLGLKIKEVSIHFNPRSVWAGKKIRYIDGWKAFKVLWILRNWSKKGL